MLKGAVDGTRTRARRSFSPSPFALLVSASVPHSSARAATSSRQKSDVWDHPAPYQVRGDREKLEQVFAGLLGWDINRSPSSTGVLMGVVRDPREDGRWVASTAFEWAHASWDNV